MAIRTPIGVPGAGDDDRHVPGGALHFQAWWSDRAFLQRYCRSIVGDDHTADDIVQETYLKALDNLEELESRASVVPWLVTVAKNLSLNEIRRRNRHGLPVEDVPDPLDLAECDPADGVVVRHHVRSVLEGLSGRERRLLVRQIYQGRSVEQLAREEHTSPAAVRSLLMRARSKVRGALSEAGARVLAPLAAVGNWARKHVHSVGTKAQQFAPVLPAGEGMGQVAAVAVAAVVLAAPAAPTVASPSGSAGAPDLAVEVAGASFESPVADAAVPSRSVRPGALGDPAPLPAPPTTAGSSPSNPPTNTTSGGGQPGGSQPGPVPPIPGQPPEPPDTPPAQPEEDEAEHPDQASFSDLAYVAPAQSADGGGEQGAGSLSTGHIFGVGLPTGECYSPPCSVLFHSADEGKTWTKLRAEGLNAHKIMPAPGFPDDPRIYAMGAEGLQRSIDGGETFETVLPVAGGAPVAMSPGFADDERIYVGSSPPVAYNAKTSTIEPIAVPGASSREVDIALPPEYSYGDTFFVGAEASGSHGVRRASVYRCQKDTCTAPVSLAGVSGVPRVAVLSTATGYAVVAWRGDMAYWSHDAGGQFAAGETPEGAVLMELVGPSSGRLYAAARPLDAEGGGVLVSSDGGESWRHPADPGPLVVGAVDLVVLPTGSVIAARVRHAGGGLFCSADKAVTWQDPC